MNYKPTPKESVEQSHLFEWVARVGDSKYPELAWLYHIPNGGSRHPKEAYNLKLQGVKAGVPDISLPVARGGFHGLFIEMKVGKNKPTAHQKEWLKALDNEGYRVEVCYSFEQAKDVLEDYLGSGRNASIT